MRLLYSVIFIFSSLVVQSCVPCCVYPALSLKNDLCFLILEYLKVLQLILYQQYSIK